MVAHKSIAEMHSETNVVSDHPVCAASVASPHFLTGAATLLSEEGIIRLDSRTSLICSQSDRHGAPVKFDRCFAKPTTCSLSTICASLHYGGGLEHDCP